MASTRKLDAKPGLSLSFGAGATITANRFVTFDSDSVNVVNSSTSGGACIGVVNESAATGEQIKVVMEGVVHVDTGSGGLSAGGNVMSDTAGKAVAASGQGKRVLGRALCDAASGEVVSILLDHAQVLVP